MWGENAGTGIGTRDLSCCFVTSCQRKRDQACALHVPGTCLTLVALCFDLCVMVYSGKHKDQVRISCLEEWGGLCVAHRWAWKDETSGAGKN